MKSKIEALTAWLVEVKKDGKKQPGSLTGYKKAE